MNLHQVLTGAVNPGDHCFSVGSVGDQRFTVSAEGASRLAGRTGLGSASPVTGSESQHPAPATRSSDFERLTLQS